MVECIVNIKHGCIYLPKKYLLKAGFKADERVILRVTEHGMAFCKMGAMAEIEDFFNEIDVGLQRLFIKEKNKGYHSNGNK